MPINIEIKVVPFGQIKLEVGKSISSVEERQAPIIEEIIRYREPQETATRIYEIQYEEKLTNYIVPISTG